MSILIDQDTNVMVQAITGTQGRTDVDRMLRFGTRLVAGVTPGKGGEEVRGIPVYDSVAAAVRDHRIDMVMSYVPPRFLKDAVADVVRAGISAMAISAERVPIHDLASMLAMARAAGTRIIGPNTLGVVSPGKALIGGIGGENPDRALAPGPVGIMSKSGGMGAELCWILRRAGLGQSTYASLGGEAMSGTTFRDLLELFQHDPETGAVIMWGEAGAPYEEEAADFIRCGGFTKPIYAVIAGRFTETLPGVRFGHGGTIINGLAGTPSAKIKVLESAGVQVVQRLSELPVNIGRDLGIKVTTAA